MTCFFTRLFAARTPAPTSRAPAAALHLESLEARISPSTISRAIKEVTHIIGQFGPSHIQSSGRITTSSLLSRY